jgi:hypothetical protein
MRWIWKRALSVAAVLIAGPVLRADTIWISSRGAALKVDGIKIQSVAGDLVQYINDGGVSSKRPLSQLLQINIDGETNFNAAEDAFAKKDYDTAVSGYETILKSSGSKDWMQDRAAARLLVAAKAKNRFDAEVSAYVFLLQKDPEMASKNKPAEPAAHSPYLDAALTSVTNALGNSRLDASSKSALLNLQLQIDRAKGDSAAVNATLAQLVALGGASDADKAMLKLAAAGVAYDAKQYAQAISDIEQNRAMFTAPDQQVDALFILAESKEALNGDKTDADTLKDLALNYMRVVTFGSQLPDRPHVAVSLYQTALIEEKLKEPQAAITLLQQVVRDKANTGSAILPSAQAELDRLSKESAAAK